MTYTPCVASTFGFHTAETFPIMTYVYDKQDIYSEKNSGMQRWDHNMYNIIGYIPVVGLISCAAHLIIPLFLDENDPLHGRPTAFKVATYMRGLVEGLGLGGIYLFPRSASHRLPTLDPISILD